MANKKTKYKAISINESRVCIGTKKQVSTLTKISNGWFNLCVNQNVNQNGFDVEKIS